MPPDNHTRWSHGGPPASVASFSQQPAQARAPAPQARAVPQAHHQARPPTPVHRGRQYVHQEVPQAHSVPVVQVSAPQPEEEKADREDPARGFDRQQPDPFPETRQAMQQFDLQGAAYRPAFSRLSSPPTSFAAYRTSSNTSGVPATRCSRRKKVPKRSLGYVEGHDVHSAINNDDEDLFQSRRHDIEQQSLTPSQEIAEILDDDSML